MLTYLENDSLFIYDLFKFASVVRISCLPLTIYVFFVYSRKVNDSNDKVNIKTDESNCSSRDDIEALNMSESSSSAELSTDDEIHPSVTNEMRFANSEETRRHHCLFDERRYEKEYNWLYYNFNKKDYLRKICEGFYAESSAKPGGSTGHSRIIPLSLKIILVKN